MIPSPLPPWRRVWQTGLRAVWWRKRHASSDPSVLLHEDGRVRKQRGRSLNLNLDRNLRYRTGRGYSYRVRTQLCWKGLQELGRNLLIHKTCPTEPHALVKLLISGLSLKPGASSGRSVFGLRAIPKNICLKAKDGV